jgi:hypothetical protein
MKTIQFLILLFVGQIIFIPTLFAGNQPNKLEKTKQHFYSAKQEIVEMLNGKQELSYERAIILLENAYWEEKINTSFFRHSLNFHTYNIQKIIDANRNESSRNFKQTLLESIEQQEEKYNNALTNWAIFSYLTDTIFFNGQDGVLLFHSPFSYSTKDPLGTTDWSNTQVFNLLNNKKGNCFALTSLFKIFSERLNSEVTICTAPSHIYIRTADHKGIYHNVELATKSFPGTGSMETLTYTTDEATKNGISLRELNLKQSIALCLVYLAKGYEYKYQTKDDDFLLECAKLALEYDNLNLNAMLLKAQVLEARILNKNKPINELQTDKTFQEYEKLITYLFDLGYREMPKEMKDLVISRLRNENTPYPMKDYTPKPFEHLGVKNDRYATLSGGLFDERMETKPLEQYHRTIFDTKKMKITKFVSIDTTYNNYPIDLVVFAWSIDPLAHQFPSLSPYNAFNNNPIVNVDTDGRKFVTYIKVKNEETGKTVTKKVTFDGVKTTMQTMRKGKLVGGAVEYTAGTSQFVDDMVTSYNYIVENKADIDNAMQKVASSDIEVEVKFGKGRGDYWKSKIRYDFSYGLEVYDKDNKLIGIQSSALGFWSEAYHAYIDLIDISTKDVLKDLATEENYVHLTKESKVVDKLKGNDPTNNEAKRATYNMKGGDNFPVKTKGVTSTKKKKK